MKLQEYLKTKKNFSTELVEIFKTFISYKDHDLTEEGEDRVEYIIKKLGINEKESGIIEQLEYFLGFKLDISAGVSDKELFTKIKQIEGFKSNFFKEGGIEISEQIKSVDKYLKYFEYDDLSEIDNKAIAKLNNIKEFWDDSNNANEGENNSSSDYSAASYQVLKYFKKLGAVEEVEIIKFKEIIYTLGITSKEVQDENIAKKLNLLLEGFGINKAGDFSSENLDKIRILKEELNIRVREDLKLEIKEKINIIEEFKLVDAGYEEIRVVTGFLGRLGKKISNIEEGVGPDIENYKLAIDKLGIRNVPISEIDNVIANLGILGTSLANIIQFPSSFDTIKEATNLLTGEEFNKLKSQAIWNIVEVLKIFLGVNCAEIKGEDLIQITKLAKVFKNLNIKVEELPYGNSMRFKEALKRLDVTLDTPEGNVSEVQKIFAILDIKAGELNENTVSNFIALNHEFTEIIPKESRLVEPVYKGKILQEKDARIIKEIGNAFLYQRVGEINTQEISKIKEFLKLANVLDLKSVNQSEIEKLGIIISELGINIRNIAQKQIEN
ncbi:MAG: hypothetical protein O3C05_00985, partial [Proteobacteria bacterium]|nr:hypothetical protein [Pseudomonadota bacterium]